jgi:hypothetical protein
MLEHVSRTEYGIQRSMGILDQFDLPNDFLDEWREYEKDVDKNCVMPDGTYLANNCEHIGSPIDTECVLMCASTLKGIREYKWEKRELFFHDGRGFCFVKKGRILGKATCWTCDCEQFMKHLNCVHAYALQYPEHIRLMAKGTKDKQGRNTSKRRRSRYEDTQETATSKKMRVLHFNLFILKYIYILLLLQYN